MQAMILVIKILGYSKIKNTFNYLFFYKILIIKKLFIKVNHFRTVLEFKIIHLIKLYLNIESV
jgi:hypothetical protein